jgi:uncharacterized protein (DUF2164 family)
MLIKLAKEQKGQLINLVQEYFLKERGEILGDLAAEFLLDFMFKQLTPVIYNQAVYDIQTVLLQKMAGVEEDIEALKQPVKFFYD